MEQTAGYHLCDKHARTPAPDMAAATTTPAILRPGKYCAHAKKAVQKLSHTFKVVCQV